MNPKQRTFCEEYLIDLNATQAAIRAGYSEKTASEIGYENLRKPQIVEHITKLQQERSERTQITADSVLQELAKLGFGNIQNLYDEDGNLLHPQELPPEVSATIQEVTEEVLRGATAKATTQDGEDEEIAAVVLRRKYKVADKKASLELLGKHLKLFTEKIEHSGEIKTGDLTDEELAAKFKAMQKSQED